MNVRHAEYSALAKQLVDKFAIGKLGFRREGMMKVLLYELYRLLTYPQYTGPDYQTIIKKYMVDIQGEDELVATVESTVLAEHIKNELIRQS